MVYSVLVKKDTGPKHPISLQKSLSKHLLELSLYLWPLKKWDKFDLFTVIELIKVLHQRTKKYIYQVYEFMFL